MGTGKTEAGRLNELTRTTTILAVSEEPDIAEAVSYAACR
jgi:hypothetical protein